MALYAGIDLHSTNSMVVVQDEAEKIRFRQRMPNDLTVVLKGLEPYRQELVGVVVESTYNWYWLVDGLQAAGYRVHLANTVAIQQYAGVKYRDDRSDARWLARLLQLGLLPEGHIYPREERAIRDLLRKRAQLVRQATRNLLSIQSMSARHLGHRPSGNAVKRLTPADMPVLFEQEHVALAATSNLAVLHCLEEQINLLEQSIYLKLKPRPEYQRLQTVPGIGRILAATIMLEAGDLGRFASAGHFVSYGRLVGSRYMSNDKRKGAGNAKNGNPYLCWAFIEAAHYAMRYNETIRSYYQSKAARTKPVLARKAIAHKLGRACYYLIKDNVDFQVERAFGRN